MSNKRRPRWALLYLILTLAGALFFLESRAMLSGTAREAVQLGILALAFALVFSWFVSNRVALLRDVPSKASGAPTYSYRLVTTMSVPKGQSAQSQVAPADDSGSELFGVPVFVGDSLSGDIDGQRT